MSARDVLPLVDLQAQYRSIKEEVDQAIAAVIAESAFVGTAGNRFVRAFEAEFAAYTERDHCVACANGTDALEILLQAAGIGPGDEVLVPAVSWIATSEAVSTRGATPIFVDILPDLYSMDPGAARARLTPRTKAIIPVHLYGAPARMYELCELATGAGLFVLEDCAQAVGARYFGQQVGTFGHAASHSFFPGKNLGAWGDAGAMVTNDEALARRARMIAQHGQTERKHDHLMEGRNSRLDGLQASVLSAKLKHLPAWTGARRALAERYRVQLQDVIDGMQVIPAGFESVYHLFVIEVSNRDEVAAALAAKGISTAVQYPKPLPMLRAYKDRGHTPAEFPVAHAVTDRILSLPLYPELTMAQQMRVCDSLRKVRGIAMT